MKVMCTRCGSEARSFHTIFVSGDSHTWRICCSCTSWLIREFSGEHVVVRADRAKVYVVPPEPDTAAMGEDADVSAPE
jgi:hypothetical protein